MADNNSGSSNALVFIIGGLVVAVAVIGWVLYNGGISVGGTSSGTNNTDIKIEVPSAGTSESPST